MMERKMHFGRRLAALVLCLCSVLSILPLPARAEDTAETQETEVQTAETRETEAQTAETRETEAATEAAETEPAETAAQETAPAETAAQETEPTLPRPMPRPVGPVLTAQAEDFQAQAQTFLENALPEDAALAMTLLREEDYETCWAQVEEALETPLTQAHFFDLRLLSGETEVEPAAGTVTVTLTLPQELEAGLVDVVHFKETYVARLDAQVEGTKVTFQTDSFSRFGIIVRESRVPNEGWGVFREITVSFVLNNNNLPSVPSFTATGNTKMKPYFDDGSIPTTVEDVDANGHPNQIFQGWYNNNGRTPYTSESQFTNNNMTFYAKWGNPPAVTFNLGEAQGQANAPEAPSPIRVHPGKSLSDYPAPPLPTLEWKDDDGSWVKAFDGWYTARTGGTLFTDKTTIDRNITVYAHWTELVKITFNIGKAPGDAPAAITVLPNTVIPQMPQDPVWVVDGKPVCLFMGWYTDEEFKTPFDPFQPVKNSTVLYAKWAEPVTVTFNVGGALEGNEPPQAPAAVVVAEGTTGLTLPTVRWLDEDKAPLYFLVGWYSDADCTTPYNPGTPIIQDTTLYAKWEKATDENTVTVSFYFTEGGSNIVAMTRQVLKNQTVQAPAGPITKDRLFQGWSETEQTEDNYEDSFADVEFDFNTPITQNLDLYAWYSEICTVTFEMNGGNPIPPLTVAKGGKIKEEDLNPQRYGYTFKQWTYADGTPFIPGTSISENITLYADWTAVMAQVHIVELFEDANQDIYNDPAEVDHRIVWAPVGSYVNVLNLDSGLSDAKRYDAEHEIVYSDTPLGADVKTTPVETNDPTGKKETGKIRDSREDPTITGDDTHYFQYLRASTDAKVRPDGSTTLYVYYRRVRVTLVFRFPGTHAEKPTTATASIDPKGAISDADMKKYAVEISNMSDGNGFTYQLTAKYKQKIASVWPRNAWLNLTPSTTGDRAFNAWVRPGDKGQQTTLMHTMESSLIGAKDYYYDESGQMYFESTANALGKQNSQVHIWLLYILDTLPGQTPDFVYKGKNYSVRSEGAQLAFMEQFVTYKTISIGDPIFPKQDGTLIIFNQPYKYTGNGNGLKDTSTSINGYRATGATLPTTATSGEEITGFNGATILDVFNANFKSKDETNPNDYDKDITNATEKGPNHCNFQVLPYNRHEVILTVHPNLPGYDTKYKQTCMKEEKIFDNPDGKYDYFNDLRPDQLRQFVDENNNWIPSQNNPAAEAFEETHRFVGWYTTPSFSKGTEFYPNENSQILTSMELYAKWEPVAFQVQYHVLDETHREGFQEGAYLEEYTLGEVPGIYPSAELLSSFIAWYWYSPNDPDKLVEFDFSQKVGENFTQDGVLHLYAKFNPVPSQVIYYRGENEGLPPEPIQGGNYNLGTVCQLKDADGVWGKDAIEKTDMTFLGWQRNGKYYRPGQYVVITDPTMEFTALWADEEPIKLIYDGNGAEQECVTELLEAQKPHPVWNNLDVNKDVDPDDPASRWVPHFTWEGRKLLGWSLDKNSATPDYKLDGTAVTPGTITPKEGETEITLYAVWEQQVTVTYHPNSVTAVPQAPRQTSHSPDTLVTVWNNQDYGGVAHFTNEGYIFKGWSTTPDPSQGTEYAPGNTIQLTEDLLTNGNLDLYAIWERDESDDAYPRVLYHSNPPMTDVTEEIKIEKGEYNVFISIWTNTTNGKDPVFQYQGYQFLGWSTNPNASEPDDDCAVGDWTGKIEDNHSNAKQIFLNHDDNKEVHYYAVWKALPNIQVQVKKLVEGSLGDKTKSFSFTVTYTDGEVKSEPQTFDLKHDETKELSIPRGAVLTIEETGAEDYTMTCDRGGTVSGHTATVTLPQEAPSEPYVITVTNKKDPTPDTGVSLDRLPALILLAVSVLGGGLLLLRRRRYL